MLDILIIIGIAFLIIWGIIIVCWAGTALLWIIYLIGYFLFTTTFAAIKHIPTVWDYCRTIVWSLISLYRNRKM